MKTTFRALFYLALAIPTIAISGCASAPPGFPAVVPCKIIVLKDDIPLPHVTVRLISEGGKEWIAGATSDASGVAEVRTTMMNYVRSGAPPGEYRVVLSQIPQITTQYTQQQWFDMSPAESERARLQIDREIAKSRSFPVEFECTVKTPITIEVTQGRATVRLDVSEWIQ